MTSRARRWPLVLLLCLPQVARADRPSGTCIDVGVHFTPSANLQIVAWLEKADGTFVDTLYITSKVGRYGLGNRPGRFDFNSGPPTADNWPYGRRITTFPVWAHRQGRSYPEVVFQNGDDNNLSHPFDQSSPEAMPPYCRPMMPDENGWDTGTCASRVFTDKGVFSSTGTSLYPPRADITRQAGLDSASVDMYRAMNPYDAITQATPAEGTPTAVDWAVPQSIDLGDYVLWIEVAKEYDFNGTYNATTYPSPTGIPWGSYGQPYRGQPSVVYSVPFTLATTAVQASTQSYAGYGDPDGVDGNLRPPDTTITTDTTGSGGSRLELVSDASGMYRVQVDMTPEVDSVPPAAPAELLPTAVGGSNATIQFVAPGDDGTTGTATKYEIRVRANTEMTADNFDGSMPVTATVLPVAAGGTQSFEVDGLLPLTDYWVGVRAYDNCYNAGPIAITKFTTTDRQSGEVSACFVATAAYGSVMANEVEMLRRFRDAMLQTNVLGELAVETYYTFGPAVAGVVGESELLRATARGILGPIVEWVRALSF